MLLARPRSTVSQATRAAVVGLSASLFVVGLFLPALEFHSVNGAILGTPPYPNAPGFDPTLDLWKGGTALFTGFFGIVDWDMAGYANPFLWLAWVYLLLDRIRSAAKAAITAAVLSLLTFRLYTVPIPVDEGSVKHELLAHLHIGAYLWFASLVVPMAAGIVWWNREAAPVMKPAYAAPYAVPPPPFHAPPPPPTHPPPPPPNPDSR